MKNLLLAITLLLSTNLALAEDGKGFGALGDMLKGIIKETTGVTDVLQDKPQSPTSTSRGRSYTAMGDAALEIYPFEGLDPSERGLIPASDLTPARIVVKNAQPDYNVTFSLEDKAKGEFRIGDRAGKTMTVRSDARGNAQIYFYYTGFRNNTMLSAPETYLFMADTGRRKLKGYIEVGLGLVFDRVVPVMESGDVSGVKETYALGLSVKSAFHPRLPVSNYLNRAHDSGVWGDKKFGMKLITQWVNQEGEEHDLRYQSAYNRQVTGTVTINSVGNMKSMLWAASGDPKWNNDDRLSGNHFLPAVKLMSSGKHIYRVVARPAILGANGDAIADTGEQVTRNDALLVLSREEGGEKWYTSLACSLEAQDYDQYLMLEVTKSMPIYGDAAGVFLTATSLACNLAQGEYEKALIGIGTVLGGKVLDKLSDPAQLAKFTERQQREILAAKKAYDALDDVGKNRERDEAIEKSRAKGVYVQPASTAPSSDGTPAGTLQDLKGNLKDKLKGLIN